MSESEAAAAVVGPPLVLTTSGAEASEPGPRCQAVARVAEVVAAGLDVDDALQTAVGFVLSRYYAQPSVALPLLPGTSSIAVTFGPTASWADVRDGRVPCALTPQSALALLDGVGDGVDDGVGNIDRRNYPVVLGARRLDRDLLLLADYDRGRVDDDTVDRLLGHVGVALRAMADDPHAPTATTGLLTDEERRVIVEEWNRTNRPAPDVPFHVLFERQASARPYAAAVVDRGQTITYGDLNARANRLCHHLLDLGVRRGALVGLCLSRSPEFQVAVLAVMKAGAAYVPLDSLLYPADRIAFMVEDTSLDVIITESALLALLPDTAAALVSVDDDADAIAARPSDSPPNTVELDDVAYAMYTSGSTGQPKCVLVTHRGVVNLVAAVPIVGVHPSSHVLQFAPCSFDISVGDAVLALSVGATLHLATLDSLLSPDALLDQLREEHITNIQVSPSVLASLPVAELPELQTIIVGAEPCPADLVARWGQRHRFLNVYGPTEATVCATYKECTDPAQTPPIGKPIPNVRIYVLDEAGHPLPVGVAGEVFIGGAGVAAGYHNRPELTAERFLPDPFAGDATARMYRTGDLARWLADGDLEFLGRIDDQVKILGHRIELGEIESVLSTHAAVRDCVVAAVGEGTARRLVGYVVDHGERPTTTALRAHLRSRLPEFMVPAVFVHLEVLPLTPNGKVDRTALPAPGTARPGLDHDYVAPDGELEEVLADIWAAVLGLDRVGATDNFFELGGDSILAIQAVADANRAGLRLQARQLHQHPTIAGLAKVAGTAAAVVADQGVVVGAVPLTPIQRWFLAQRSPDPANYAFSVLFDLPVNLPPGVLEAALAELVRHHDALRMRFTNRGGQWRQENAGFGLWDFAFEEVTLPAAGTPGRDERRKAACDAGRAHLRLDRGPLLAATLFRTPAGEPDQLAIAVHHLVLDGISWRILLDDLAAATDQHMAGGKVELPPKTSSFLHWARRLAELAASGELQAHAARWLNPPAGARAGLLRDGPEAGDQGEKNVAATERHVTIALDEATTGRLLTAAPTNWRAGVTDLLLASVVHAVCQWAGRRALAVDVETHGREDLWPDTDVSRTVGWFTAMCPIDVVAQGEGIASTVEAVKEGMRERVDHAVEYGLLRWAGGPVAEQLAALPAPRLGFNYLGQFDTGLAGVTVAEGPGELTGLLQDPRAPRPHDIDVTAYVLGGRLHLDWAYSEALHDVASIETMAEGARGHLAEITEADASVSRQALGPGDFPLAGLDRRGLETVLSVVDAATADVEGTLT